VVLLGLGRDDGEEVDERLCRPALPEVVDPPQPNARTTKVWLWKPLTPRVRAISP
jgi:hypothetical protein